MARECVTHHHACDCREEHFRELESKLDSLTEQVQLLGIELTQKSSQLDKLQEYASDCYACTPYLKEGEKPAECIQRNRDDTSQVIGLYAEALKRAEAAETRLGHTEKYLRDVLKRENYSRSDKAEVAACALNELNGAVSHKECRDGSCEICSPAVDRQGECGASLLAPNGWATCSLPKGHREAHGYAIEQESK